MARGNVMISFQLHSRLWLLAYKAFFGQMVFLHSIPVYFCPLAQWASTILNGNGAICGSNLSILSIIIILIMNVRPTPKTVAVTPRKAKMSPSSPSLPLSPYFHHPPSLTMAAY